MDTFYAYARGTVASAAALSSIAAGLIYYGQNYLIYPGHMEEWRKDIPVPSQFGMEYEQITLTTPDNVKIKAYVILQDPEDWISNKRPTVLMFHGNGGNYGQRVPLAKQFWRMKCNVVMLCYRGYGDSEGSSSESGFQIDSQTILNYINEHKVLKGTKIILYGQSIGGAVAIDLASRNPDAIHALILENTFTNLPRLVPNALPALSRFAWLCHQKWPSDKRLPLIPPSTPILFLSGRADLIVPPEHMTDLWNISLESRRENGVWVEFADKGHNDTASCREYWDAVVAFVAKVTKPAS